MNANKAVRRVFVTTFLSFILVLFTLATYLLKQPEHSSFSQDLTLEEQRAIAATVRRHGVVSVMRAVNSGRFAFAMERFRDLPKTVVYAQGHQSDGKIWIHVGIRDANETDGFRLFSRHMLLRMDQGWEVLNDF